MRKSSTLRNRLSLTYAFFISAALLLLTLVINISVKAMFSSLAKDNIAERSAEIRRAVGDLYNPFTAIFDVPAVEAIGMVFTHEGYIITVRDTNGEVVWDAVACDMEECNRVITEIRARMEDDKKANGGMRRETYPLLFHDVPIGTLDLETYGPYFYSETEKNFLRSLNRLLAVAGGVFIFVSILLSLVLGAAISRPVQKASAAAQSIAEGNLDARIEGASRIKELQELAASINTMAAELKEAERRQMQLTSDVAHELRTPLTCLQGNLEALIDGIWEPTAERLVSCHEETKRLTKLVEDLSALTRIEWQGIPLNKSDFDLSDLLRLVTQSFESAATEKGIAITCEKLPPLPVRADYDRMKQVFFNIVSNGVKYTDEGGVVLRGRQLESEGQCEVTVTDTGIGIPREDLPHIFERFYRTDKSRSRATGGSGVGLTIAAAILRAHGGTVRAESGGEGSVFTVII
jgi:signal transduction histidine kinase